jgi:KaiC/GvpD/RAD55 family RecA-like ATPase
VVDSYTTQIGLNLSEESRGSAKIETVAEKSLKLADWSIGIAKDMKMEAVAEIDKRRLHIDDNSSVLLQYNDEKVIIDVWRTRNLPHTRVRESVFLYALLTEVGSPSFQKQLESISDGIIEFKSEDKGGEIEQYVRVSTMRGRSYDSRWRRLQLLDNEVKLVG